MIVALTITKYRTLAIPFAFMGMAALRIPLWLNKQCRFWKLLGSGRNAQVDESPDFKHWAILTAWDDRADCDEFYKSSFIVKWFRYFSKEEFTILLKPLSVHGYWSGKQPFKTGQGSTTDNLPIAVLTRARIRPGKLADFRSHIKSAADAMRTAPGFILSAGIGENPFFDQATFSVWTDAASMKNYAYRSANHADVIKLTRERDWYSEELFARFEILNQIGTLNGQSIYTKTKGQ